MDFLAIGLGCLVRRLVGLQWLFPGDDPMHKSRATAVTPFHATRPRCNHSVACWFRHCPSSACCNLHAGKEGTGQPPPLSATV